MSGNQLASGEGIARTTFAMPPVTPEGYLELKPGLWIRTASAAGQELGEDRICIDKTVYHLMQPKRDIARVLGEECDSVQQNAGPPGISFSTVCRRLGETRVEGIMTGTDEMLRTEFNTQTPDGTGGAAYVIESKWAGACPAEMEIGDTE